MISLYRPVVVDGRRVTVKTHWLGRDSAPMCGVGQRVTRNHDRVTCRRCLAYPYHPPPGVQAMRRIAADHDRIIESPVVEYVRERGEFRYTGPLYVAMQHITDREVWIDTHGEGHLVALCAGHPGEVFTEWGTGPTFAEALRFAIAAYLTHEQEWRIAEEVMW